MDAEALRLGTNSRDRLTARLESHGYNADAINAAAFVHELDALATIEKFLTAARHQVANMFREVRFHREFTKRANEATQRFLAELKTREQTPIGQQEAEAEPS